MSIMRISLKRNIYLLKSSWKRIISNKEDEIFLTYDFNERLYREFIVRKLFGSTYKNCECCFVCGTIDKKTAVILPLAVDHTSRRIAFPGELFGAGYNDIICSSVVSDNQIRELFEYVKKKYPAYSIQLTDLRESSRLCKVFRCEFFRDCYALAVTGGYLDWYNSLSKNTRQTIRLSYNRLKADQCRYEYCCREKAGLFFRFALYRIYRKRLKIILPPPKEADSNKRGKLYSNIKFCYEFFANAFFSGINTVKREKILYLTINGKIAAFLIAFNEKNGVIASRCGFDMKYERYSPGVALISEIIKNSTEPGKCFKLDFSRGFFEYKVRYGCKEYSNLKLTIQ